MPVNPAGPDTTLVSGRYRLHEVLGAGGMGTVWRATDELLGREVALKQLRNTHLNPADAELAQARTMREARIAAALHHPNVVSIFDVLVDNGGLWLVLEYVPSVSLGGLIDKRGRLSPGEAAAIGAQAAAALACAHAAGIVHRDVKPDNLLVTPTISKLTDFGIAHAATADPLTGTGLLTGTIAYLAPETARGEGTDSRSDMYALGATLFTAVEGTPPFGTGGDLLVMITRIGRGGAPVPHHGGPLTALIGHLLADDPADRPTAMQAHQALSRLTTPAIPGPTDRPAPSRPPGPWAAPAQPAPAPTSGGRRRLLRTVAIIALAVAVLGSAAWLAVVRGTADGPVDAADEPVGIADLRTADPCSLIDTAALSRHGVTALDPENTGLNSCRANITLPGDDIVSVFAVLRTPLAPDDELGGTHEQIGALTLARFPVDEQSCRRQVLLPDRNRININVERYGASTADHCTIADTAATAATTLITERGIATRTPPDAGTPLAGRNACDLLTPAELVAAVPGLPLSGKPGLAGWSCVWARSSGDEVEIFYIRALPPSETPKSTGVDIGGREAATRVSNGSCTTEFAQHYYTDREGQRRAYNVLVTVNGTAPEAELCIPATTLARVVATKLPPPA